MTFSVTDVGRLMDAGEARFEWDQDEPALSFTLGDFHRRIELGKKIVLVLEGMPKAEMQERNHGE